MNTGTETVESLRAQRNELLKILEQASADLIDAAEALAGTKRFAATAQASANLLIRLKKLADSVLQS